MRKQSKKIPNPRQLPRVRPKDVKEAKRKKKEQRNGQNPTATD